MDSVNLGSVYLTLEARDDGFNSALDRAQQNANAALNNTAATTQNFATRTSQAFGSVAAGIMSVLKPVAVFAATSSLGFGALVKFGFDATREIQKSVAAMVALTGSSKEAGSIIKDMVDYVQGKPFDRLEVIAATKQLLAFGRGTKDVRSDIELLGRAVILTGGRFEDIARIYGKVSSQGRLMAQEFNQLTDAGINIGGALSNITGKSIREVMDAMEKGEISFKVFRQALETVLPADIVATASNTIDNRIKSLTASFRNLAFDILGVDFSKIDGRPLIKVGGLLDGIIDAVEGVITKLRSPEIRNTFGSLGQDFAGLAKNAIPAVVDGLIFLVKNLKTAIQLFIALASAFAFAKFGQIAFAFATGAVKIGILTGVIKGATAAQWGFNAAATANPIGLVVTAVTALVGALVFLQLRYGIITKLFNATKPIIQPIINLYKELWGEVQELGRTLLKELAPAIDFVKQNWDSIKKVLLVVLAVAITPLIAQFVVMVAILKALTKTIAFVNDHFDTIKQVIKTVITVALLPIIATIKLVQKAAELLGIEWGDVWDGITATAKTAKNLVTDSINDMKETVDDFKEAFENIGNTVTRWKNNIVNGVREAKGQVDSNIDRISEKVRTVKTSFDNAREVVSKGFDGGDGTKRLLSNLDSINNSLAGFINGVLGRWTGAWKEMSKTLGNFGMEAGNSLASTWNNLYASISEFVTGLPQRMGQIGMNIGFALSNAWNTAYANVTTFFSNIDNNLVTFGSGIWQKITTAWNTAYQATVTFFKTLPERLKPTSDETGTKTAKSVTDSAKNEISKIETIRKIGDAIATMFALAVIAAIIYIVDAGIRAGRALIRGFNDGMNAMRGALGGALSSVFDGIGRFLGGVGNWLVDSGRALISGFVRGMQSVASWPADAARGILDRVRRLFPSSPAKEGPFSGKGWTLYSGRSLMEGMAEGVKQRQTLVSNAMTNAISSISSDLAFAQGSIGGAIQAQVTAPRIPTVDQSNQAAPLVVNGDINIGSQSDADYFIDKFNRMQALRDNGLVGA